MKVPISWLKQFVDVTETPAELAGLLTNAGLEVDGIEYIGVEGAPLVWDRSLLLLGHILKVEPHPDAEKLVMATVDYGSAEPKIVITGAPNLRPYLGDSQMAERQLYSPIIFEGGTYLDVYKENKPTKLKGKALRGIYNDAMLCSSAELGLDGDHDGIILMQKDASSPNYQAGMPLQDLLGDAVLEIAIIPNISRAASIIGVAREVAALTGATLRYPSFEVVMEGRPIEQLVTITTDSAELNPRFVAMLIEGVTQKPAPFWMQHRLRLAGQRPINVVVDISNYVMLELGQPNHTFDYDFLRRRADQYAPEGAVHIHTRLAHEGEKLVTLNGVGHQLLPNNILVTDPLGNLSLGGIMGGKDSEIQPDTTNVLLEAAAWNFINIRQTARQLGMHSEASFRFSRGVHPQQALLGAKRAAELLRTLAGGTVAQGIVDYYPLPAQPVVIELDPAYITQRSGFAISSAEIAELLRRLEFDVVENGELLSVTVPDHRLDVESKHDLLEEVCRMYGYDRIPTTLLAESLPVQRSNPEFELEERIKDLLVQLGFYEAITYRLTTDQAEGRAILGQPDDRPYIRLTNPSTQERVVMRHNLLASVLEMVESNSRYQQEIAFFEIGRIYLKQEGELLPAELPRLAIAMTGLRERPHWQIGDDAPLYDFFDLKGVVETLFKGLGVSVRYESAEHPTFRPGRTAAIYLGNSKKQLGIFGELHPLVVNNYEFQIERNQPILAADIDLALLFNNLPSSRRVQSLPVYPAVRQDLALVVDQSVSSAQIVQAIQNAGGAWLTEIELFDLYLGDKLPEGKKSLAYHLTMQSADKTLTDKETQKLREKILRQLNTTLGATLRE